VTAEKAKAPTFEDALGKLESIVESMEDGGTPLAEMISKYEEGNKLLKVCEGRLKEAELKIEQLKRKRDGVETAPFEPTKGD
jgi:exodeoxyribonuclease VII small subunit